MFYFLQLFLEVGSQLLDIFLLIGAPHILQFDNGREFTANVIKEVKDMWPDCSIVHGKHKHPQSCLKESSFSLFIDPMSKNLFRQ
jgi:hypothetical protein